MLVTLNLLIIGHLLWSRHALKLRTWLLAQTATFALYLPWLPIAWRQATNPPVPPWRSLRPVQSVALEAWTALSLGQSVQARQVWPVLLITAILFLLGLQSRNLGAQFSNLQAPILLVTYTFGPLMLIYLASLIVPLYHVRYLFTYAAPFYIQLGSGLAWLNRRSHLLAFGAASVLVAGSTYSIRELHFNPRYAADDFRAAVRLIAERWRPGDAVLINAGYAYTGFLHYHEGPIADRVRLTDFQPPDDIPREWPDRPLLVVTGTIGGDPNLGWGDPSADFYSTSQAETTAALTRVTQTFPRVWMLRIYDTVTDEQGVIRNWLAANTAPFEDQPFAGESFMRVQGFMSSLQPTPPEGTEIALEGGITLLGWRVSPTVPQTAGGPLDVVLWWQVDDPSPAAKQEPDSPYAVSLKLWGKDSPVTETDAHLAAQRDEWPLGSLFLTSDWPPGRAIRHPMRLWLAHDLSPGQYRLEVEVYDPATVQPLLRQDGTGHIIPLGPVTVTEHQ